MADSKHEDDALSDAERADPETPARAGRGAAGRPKAPKRPPAAAVAAVAERRGPGRPSTKPPPPHLEKKGIVTSPDDPRNRLEFVYGDPMVFKALFTYLKNI